VRPDEIAKLGVRAVLLSAQEVAGGEVREIEFGDKEAALRPLA